MDSPGGQSVGAYGLLLKAVRLNKQILYRIQFFCSRLKLELSSGERQALNFLRK